MARCRRSALSTPRPAPPLRPAARRRRVPTCGAPAPCGPARRLNFGSSGQHSGSDQGRRCTSVGPPAGSGRRAGGSGRSGWSIVGGHTPRTFPSTGNLAARSSTLGTGRPRSRKVAQSATCKGAYPLTALAHDLPEPTGDDTRSGEVALRAQTSHDLRQPARAGPAGPAQTHSPQRLGRACPATSGSAPLLRRWTTARFSSDQRGNCNERRHRVRRPDHDGQPDRISPRHLTFERLRVRSLRLDPIDPTGTPNRGATASDRRTPCGRIVGTQRPVEQYDLRRHVAMDVRQAPDRQSARSGS